MTDEEIQAFVNAFPMFRLVDDGDGGATVFHNTGIPYAFQGVLQIDVLTGSSRVWLSPNRVVALAKAGIEAPARRGPFNTPHAAAAWCLLEGYIV